VKLLPDAIFGVGQVLKGLVHSDLSGPALLSGGSAGLEGSAVALVLCLAVGAYLLARAGRRGNIVGPARNRERQRTAR
jgi:hypothetical protein